jgi:late competence protein required for DNA uptake (superfamily II DNA/RNA helicase)
VQSTKLVIKWHHTKLLRCNFSKKIINRRIINKNKIEATINTILRKDMKASW